MKGKDYEYCITKSRKKQEFEHRLPSSACMQELLLMASNKVGPTFYIRPKKSILHDLPNVDGAVQKCEECNEYVYIFQMDDHEDGHTELNRGEEKSDEFSL